MKKAVGKEKIVSKSGEPPEVKCLFLGSEGVGKSAILMSWLYESFADKYVPSVGLQFGEKEVSTERGDLVHLKLIDAAGSERYYAVAKMMYKQSPVIVVVISSTDEDWQTDLEKWLARVQEGKRSDAQIVIVGSRSDEEGKKVNEAGIRGVFEKSFPGLLKSWVGYVECSAKDKTGLDELEAAVIKAWERSLQAV